MTKKTDKKKKIALISGGADEAYNTVFANNFSTRINSLGGNVLWFMSLSDKYDGEPHDVGEVNIYNLINYKKIDGLVILTLTMKHDESVNNIIKRAKEGGIPVISLDKEIEGVYNISLGYEDALYDLINHVIDVHGRKKLAFIGGLKGNSASGLRENVFRRVMEEHNLPLEEDSIGYGSFWSGPTREWVVSYYNRNGSMPEAFICANDSMAIGVCEQLAEMGFRVPEDVIVTGVDGINEADTYYPPVTTVKRDIQGAGILLADRIMQIIDGEVSGSGSEVINAEKLYRMTCGCPYDIEDNFHNKVNHSLYDKIDEWNDFTTRVIHMIEVTTGGFSFEDALLKMQIFMTDIWTQLTRLCLCDNFISSVNSLEDVFASYDDYQRSGYTENIAYTLEYDHIAQKASILPPFKSEDILHDYDAYFEKYSNAMFLPVHFQDRTIGYLVAEYVTTFRNLYIFNTLITNMSMVLENIRIQSELRNFAAKLEDMYIRDSMTNLLNRRGFYQLAPKIYENCASENKEFMVLSIDLDGLKGINDVYGHNEGDNAIIITARSLSQTSDDSDIILARFGGDEYVVAGMCKNDTYERDFIERFKKALDDYNKISGKPYTVQASCGIYKRVPDKTYPIDEFIRTADELMYKQKGDNKRQRSIVRSAPR